MGVDPSILEWWYGYYEEILERFGFDRRSDEEAANMLSELMSKRSCLMDVVRGMISERTVVLAGGADVVYEDARRLAKLGPSGNVVIVSADGATKALVEAGLVPNVVVTDLDGDRNSLLEAWRAGAILVVHGHGDNLDKLREFMGILDRNVEATCQCRPRGHVHNFGGFTDGDRAAFLCLSFKPSKLVLIGMDLEGPVGTRTKDEGWYSEERAKVKREKLKVASYLFETAARFFGDEVVLLDASSSTPSVPGFKKEDLELALGPARPRH